MEDREAALSAFEERLGYRFRRRELLERALVHRSYANEQGLETNYERLEFLGDAVLGLAAAEQLFDERPRHDEGGLTRRKGHLVSSRVLAAQARALELGSLLRLGVGEERSGGRNKRSLLADALEAVLGAVFRDGGYEAARRVAGPLLEAGELDGGRDTKGRLQELAQGHGWERPLYRGTAASGPDHDRTFRVECRVGAGLVGIGEGRTKKEAEARAAAAVLAQLDDEA